MSQIKKAYASTDGDGHWYVIPFEMKEEFEKMLNACGDGSDNATFAFIDKFDEYRTGGDINQTQLYAEFP